MHTTTTQFLPTLGAVYRSLMVTIRDILNKLKWTGRLQDYVLVYVSRGEERNEHVVDLANLVEIGKHGFSYIENGVVRYIPYHRVIEIRSKDGKEVLIRRNVPH